MCPKLDSWQQEWIQGVKSGEVKIFSTPRSSGKSIFLEMFREQAKIKFTEVGAFPVDGEMWHTVYCGDTIAAWVQQQDVATWVETYCDPLGVCFDISEELYTMLLLRWQ